MSEGARRKLARQRRLRVLAEDGSGALKRMAQDARLPLGTCLMIPKDAAAPPPAASSSMRPKGMPGMC